MKLSENTLEILKNYAQINTGIFFRKGNIIRTVSKERTVLAEATIDETMPADFAVYELNQLLAIFSLSKDAPEIVLEGNDVVIRSHGDRSKIRYRCCDATNIKVPPTENIDLKSIDATFLLTEADLQWILRSASVLSSPNLAVEGRDGEIVLRALNAHDDSAHTDTVQVCPYAGENFTFLFKTENWKMLPGTYAVTISGKVASPAAHFVHQSRKIQYWVALEKKSK